MAQFDPQRPADNESNDRSDTSGPDVSFVADWSGAQESLDTQAVAPVTARSMPATFWVELVQSQPTPSARSTTQARRQSDSAVGVQSEQFWAELVLSQGSARGGGDSDGSYTSSLLTDPPAGRIGFADEASEWAPTAREFEPVQSAAEPVEIEASARRDDVEWSAPASAEQDWASARSEGMTYEGAYEAGPQSAGRTSLIAAAVEAALAHRKKTANALAAKSTGVKKPAAKKSVLRLAQSKSTVKPKARKPVAQAKKPTAKKTTVKKSGAKKTVVKKFVVKKLVKKTPPPPRITKAPTRRAA